MYTLTLVHFSGATLTPTEWNIIIVTLDYSFSYEKLFLQSNLNMYHLSMNLKERFCVFFFLSDQSRIC